DLRREGETLKARCRGQSGGPYRVRATLKEGAVTEADCSCPVGDGGHCKHVAALLVAWQEEPGAFREVAALGAELERLDRADLLALLRHLLRRRPELEDLVRSLLEAPLPGTAAADRPADADIY